MNQWRPCTLELFGKSTAVIVHDESVEDNAIDVPGMHGLDPSGQGLLTTLSCARPGDCSAGGYYADTIFGRQSGRVFVVDER